MTNWIYFVLQIPPGSEVEQIKILSLVTQAGPVVKAVLLILLLMSVISWAIIFSKYFVLNTLPNYAWISPNMWNDGHYHECFYPSLLLRSSSPFMTEAELGLKPKP